MTIRESLELREKEYLSPYASLSMNTKGRLKPEEGYLSFLSFFRLYYNSFCFLVPFNGTIKRFAYRS